MTLKEFYRVHLTWTEVETLTVCKLHNSEFSDVVYTYEVFDSLRKEYQKHSKMTSLEKRVKNKTQSVFFKTEKEKEMFLKDIEFDINRVFAKFIIAVIKNYGKDSYEASLFSRKRKQTEAEYDRRIKELAKNSPVVTITTGGNKTAVHSVKNGNRYTSWYKWFPKKKTTVVR